LGGENIAHGNRYDAAGVQVAANVVTIDDPIKIGYLVAVGASFDPPIDRAMYMF
jgi:hypothetical protein